MFIDINGLAKDVFTFAKPPSIIHYLYKEKVHLGSDNNGDAILNGVRGMGKDGLDRLLESNGKETYYTDLDSINSLMNVEKYKCKFVAPWVSSFPNFLSMALPKESPYQ